jgi:DNA-binding transcriptional MocR family regulator
VALRKMAPSPPDLLRAVGAWSSPDRPLYKSLAVAIRGAIDRGELPVGARIPAERDLARALAVSRSTVVAAYDLLRQDGVLRSLRGSGTFVTAGERAWSGESITDLVPLLPNTMLTESGSTPDRIEFTAAAFPGHDVIGDVALAGIADRFRSALLGHGYQVLGRLDLRQAVAEHLTLTGLTTSANQVLITSGAQQAILLSATLFLRPGDTVLAEDPTWMGALDAFKSVRANIVGVPIDTAGVDPDATSELALRFNARALYVSPAFNNPTGTLMVETRRRELARLGDELGLPIIEDNTLANLSLGGTPPPPIAARVKRVPVTCIGSMSKLFWAGLRIGWIRAPEPIIERLARLKLVTDHGSSVISQLVAVDLMANLEEVRAHRRRLARERLDSLTSLLRQELPDWRWREPDGGLSLWIRLNRGNATEYTQVAQRHGVVIVPGSDASASRSFTDYLRLPFVHEPTTLRAGVSRLSSAWAEYQELLDHRSVHEVVV